jgi:hypothetical protein
MLNTVPIRIFLNSHILSVIHILYVSIQLGEMMSNVTISLPDEIYKRVKHLAKLNDISISRFVSHHLKTCQIEGDHNGVLDFLECTSGGVKKIPESYRFVRKELYDR